MADAISSYSDASSIATLREADEIKTFDLLNMPAPTAFKRAGTKSPPRGVKEVMLSKQIRAMKDSKHLGSSSSSQPVLLGGQPYRDPVLPGVLRTTKPPVGTTRPDDAASKKQAGSLWQSVPNFAGLRLDGGPTAPLVPTPIHAFLASLEKPKVTIVNLGEVDTRKNKEQSFDPGMEELRNYTALMDKFGLNQFMIYRGATLTGTPEFEGFRSKYNHDWGAITGVLRELEDFLRAREVKLAIINGPRLHEIASLNLPTVHRDDLISCISNIEEIKSSTTTGNKKVSMEKERGAAIAIQARIRAFIGRRHYLRDKRRAVNAIIIQSYVRRMICQRLVRDKMRLTKSHFEDQWDHNVDRLKAAWHQLNQLTAEPSVGPTAAAAASSSSRRKQRLIVLIPSISAGEYVRLSMDRMQTLQNMHIACLYQLIDPNVHVVYISPVQLTTDEATYHERFLAALGVHMPATEAKRLHFIVPELIQRLPSHMPLAQVLWYSTSALRKVKAFIKRFPRSVMVPTAMSWVERRLSNLFNVPMLSADPVTAETIQSRSFLKKVFTDACVNIPIGAHDISSTNDFYLALPRLIASNIEVRRWIFRLNVDYNNEGYAYLDVDNLSVMASLRKEMLSLLHIAHSDATGRMETGRGHGDGHEGGHGGNGGGNSNSNGGVGAWYNKQVQLDVRKRVMQCLRAEIASKAVVCRKDLHGSWDQFERYFRQYGMVIEAEPLNVIGNVQGLCFIDPSNGHVQVSHGVDVVHDDRYQAQAYIGPQSRIPKAALRGATKAVADQLYRAWKVTGYVTVEFQAYWDTLDEAPKMNALQVKFGLTPVFGGLGGAAVASGAVGSPTAAATAAAAAGGESGIGGVGGGGGGGGGVLPPSLLPRDDSQSLGGKSFVHVPFAYHKPMCTSRDDAFLKFCRMKGITFDPEARIGTLFFHVDSIVSGVVSVISLASTRKRAVESAIQALSFVVDQYGRDREATENVDGPTWDSVASILFNLRTLFKKDYVAAGKTAGGGIRGASGGFNVPGEH